MFGVRVSSLSHKYAGLSSIPAWTDYTQLTHLFILPFQKKVKVGAYAIAVRDCGAHLQSISPSSLW